MSGEEQGESAESADQSLSTPNDYSTETVFPGHKLTVSLVRKPDPQNPHQPYLASYSPHHRQRYERRYTTAEEAEEAINDAQSRAHRNFKESDRSMWD